MSDDVRVYNLGEVRSGARKRAPGAWPTLPDTGETPQSAPPNRKPADDAVTTPTPARAGKPESRAQSILAVSAALLLPGTGHLAQKRYVAGAVWALVTALLVSALTGAWAILPRLWAASEALGLPPQASVWFLGFLIVTIAAVHVSSVLAVQWRELPDLPGSPHPAGAAAASALVPGWGQLVNGHAFRGAVFLALGWTAGLSWLLAAPGVQEMLVVYGLHLPRPLALLTGSTGRWVLPAALWPLAAYDAGLWAYIHRR